MKKLNRKGFTLIELLAVIVILAILVAVAIPAVTRYLNTARKGTFAANAEAAISAVRNDIISKGTTLDGTTYNRDAINQLLDKKLLKSPYGNDYIPSSYVLFRTSDGNAVYSICLLDDQGNGLWSEVNGDNKSHTVQELNVNELNVRNNLGGKTCTPEP